MAHKNVAQRAARNGEHAYGPAEPPEQGIGQGWQRPAGRPAPAHPGRQRHPARRRRRQLQRRPRAVDAIEVVGGMSPGGSGSDIERQSSLSTAANGGRRNARLPPGPTPSTSYT